MKAKPFLSLVALTVTLQGSSLAHAQEMAAPEMPSHATAGEARPLLPDGRRASVTIASAVDTSLIWELFKNTIAASRVLGVDADFRQHLEQAQARLYPLQIGSKGQLLEWHDEYPEAEREHRHASLLVGMAWGTRITRRETPEWFAAARKSLELRGNGGFLPSKLSMCARLEDGELCYRNLDTSLNMAELFVQSHAGEIHLLPALPPAWSEGWVRGLKARGGYVMDVEWRDGRFLKGVIRAQLDGKCRVLVSVPVTVLSADSPVNCAVPEENVVEFAVRAGQTYTLHASGNPL